MSYKKSIIFGFFVSVFLITTPAYGIEVPSPEDAPPYPDDATPGTVMSLGSTEKPKLFDYL